MKPNKTGYLFWYFTPSSTKTFLQGTLLFFSPIALSSLEDRNYSPALYELCERGKKIYLQRTGE